MVAGNGMAMECRPTTGWKVFMWQLKQPVTSKSVTIFRNHDGIYELNKTFSSRFGIDMDESGSGLLYTNETLLDDAGLYICRIEGSYEDDEYSAHLTVLGKNKYCMQVKCDIAVTSLVHLFCTLTVMFLHSNSYVWVSQFNSQLYLVLAHYKGDECSNL